MGLKMIFGFCFGYNATLGWYLTEVLFDITLVNLPESIYTEFIPSRFYVSPRFVDVFAIQWQISLW